MSVSAREEKKKKRKIVASAVNLNSIIRAEKNKNNPREEETVRVKYNELLGTTSDRKKRKTKRKYQEHK